MTSLTEIDVTTIQPGQKHPVIIEAFDALENGASVIIHNDHDPKGLYYEMLSLRPESFSWTYLNNGPETWTVEIKKEDRRNKEETIGEMVRRDIAKAEVFASFGIDYCCGGKKTIAEACRDKGLNQEKLELALLDMKKGNNGSAHDFNSWNPAFLCDYIVNVHHAYVRKSSEILSDLVHKVAAHHGLENPNIGLISEKTDRVLSELAMHMRKEEVILFPYIRFMDKGKNDSESFPAIFNSVSEPVSVMEHDHDLAGDLLREIKSLSNNYTPPEGSCNSYRLLYHKLEEFEKDLHMHIHLENNILFPKALELEASRMS
jgi:regulator of cell morphogenesis and NO signaling